MTSLCSRGGPYIIHVLEEASSRPITSLWKTDIHTSLDTPLDDGLPITRRYISELFPNHYLILGLQYLDTYCCRALNRVSSLEGARRRKRHSIEVRTIDPVNHSRSPPQQSVNQVQENDINTLGEYVVSHHHHHFHPQYFTALVHFCLSRVISDQSSSDLGNMNKEICK